MTQFSQTNNGFVSILKGTPFLFKKGIKRYTLMPLAINILLFGSLFYFSFDIVESISHYFDEGSWWGSFANSTLKYFLLGVCFLGISFFFGIIASVIASPFNSLLAGKIEEVITGKPVINQTSLLKEIPRLLGSELSKLWFILIRSLGLFVFSLIPVLNIIAPLLWFMFGSKLQTFNYLDYSSGNHGYSFKQSRLILKKHKFYNLSFGACVIVLLMIPGINLFVMPLFVAGSSYAWATTINPQQT